MAFVSENYTNNNYVSRWKHSKPVPEIIKSCTSQEFDTIIQLISDTLTKLRETTSSLQFQEILNSKIVEMQNSMKHEFDQKLNAIENENFSKFNIEIQKLEQRKKELEMLLEQSNKSYNELNSNFEHLNSTANNKIEQIQYVMKKEYENNLKNVNDEISNKFNSEIERLQKNKDNLQLSLDQSVKSYENLQSVSSTQFEKTLNSMLQKQKESHESQINMINTLYKEQISKLQLSLDQYTKQKITEQNSSLKGKVGETNFDILVEQHTTWTIENTSGTAQHCDRFGIINGCKTLFEIKNYSNNVPKKEIDKFKRDLEVHKDCPVGIFISLNTKIVGAPQEFFYSEITNSNQTLIYIQQFMLNDPVSLFSIIESIIKLGNTLYNKCITYNDIEDNSIQDKIDSIKQLLINEIKNISSLLIEINKNKKLIVEKVNDNYNLVKNNLDKMKYTFEGIFKLFFGSEEDIIMSPPPEAKKAKSNRKPTSSSALILEQ